MSTAPEVRLDVRIRKWRDKLTGTTKDEILVYMGNVFVRIPMEQAYEISNQIVDLREQHERQTSGNTP